MNAHTPVQTPRCPGCAGRMLFTRSIPRVGGVPELLIFECRRCGVFYTEEAKASSIDLSAAR
jgi:hypothetical protein